VESWKGKEQGEHHTDRAEPIETAQATAANK
jgi:hypothetical protein